MNEEKYSMMQGEHVPTVDVLPVNARTLTAGVLMWKKKSERIPTSLTQCQPTALI